MTNSKEQNGGGIGIPKVYDLEAVEKKWQKKWEDSKIYQFKFDPDKPTYSVDTPPPYVSADNLHSGHLMSYSQAEFIVRYKRMKGYNVYYPMGFDDNGLPTERFVENKHKVDKSTISKSQFVKLCLKETEIGARNYKKLWDMLGMSVDWSKTYSTIAPLATRIAQASIIDIWKKDCLYRGNDPILWCPKCQTALAQADLEDFEQKSEMNHIKFKSESGRDLKVATTRPELLPACVALYVNPNDKRYAKLVSSSATVPLFGHSVPIKTSDAVDMEFGTGLMMVCTWGDLEDVEKWKTDNLETRVLFTVDGKLNELGGKYEGLLIEEARKAIITDLKRARRLIKQENIEHVMNAHERCSTPVEFLMTKQWFIRIKDLKEKWLELGEQINWHPHWRRKDYEIWVKSLKWDWCISRQRYYGVPFPIWYCAKCEEPIFAEEKDLPVNPAEDKPPVDACPRCNHGKFVPENDVMDTWAISSSSQYIIRELIEDENARKAMEPVTLRPNAYEIIRTWDFYSIVKGYYNYDSIPFTDIMISGRGSAEDGKPISKRFGNYVPAEDLVAQYGADSIRYWATGAMLGKDMRFSTQEVLKGKRTAIKLWNVARFLRMYMEDFDPDAAKEDREFADIWILDELNKVIKRSTEAFEEYEYAKARNATDEFFWSKFADYYIEFVKYRLSGDDADSKRAAQQTLDRVLRDLLKLYAPILPFITEELWSILYAGREGNESVHLSSWPKVFEVRGVERVEDFGDVVAAVDEIRKAKSERGMRLGEELEEIKLETGVNLDKYGEFLTKATRVGLIS